MKKSKVSEAIDNILGGAEEPQESSVQVKARPGRPREDGYEARTFRVKTELVEKLRFIATKEGRLQKDILEFALEDVIARYEKKHGAIDISQSNEQKKDISDIF